MKYLIALLLLAFTSLGFSQNSGIIVGKVLDKELN
ncbi:MAG: TonB-dependent receptor, partial [Flavobacteriaceae bacterium CG_4_9_14_3_um_filter_33_16]